MIAGNMGENEVPRPEGDGPQTAFDRLGGEFALRAIIDQFVDRVFSDPMIGFFFSRVSKERVKRHEYEHAAEWLGAPVRYQGRPLRVAHGPHRIMGGQFARRSRILEQVLEEHGVEAGLIGQWLTHIDSLRDEITSDPEGECIEQTPEDAGTQVSRDEPPPRNIPDEEP